MAARGPNPAVVMTSPPPDRDHSATNPRRPPAKRSVSLLHHTATHPARARKTGSASSDSDVHKRSSPGSGDGGTDSPSSLQALGGRGSSGESSNAEKWFEKSNNEVKESSASFADNDPPFFMRNSSSSVTPPEAQQAIPPISNPDGASSLPLRTGLLHLGTDGSSTEDFRSVIDDLTIENKQLKRRLKKYEKLHDSHLKDEKLFEVRIHGLPAEKKRELEETLRKFASSLGPGGANAFPPSGYASLMPALKHGKPTSSLASLQNTDSAYASMSASGQGSSGLAQEDTRMTPSRYPAVRRQNIHNYLHHIPEGLMPQQSPANMTERARKKLVVRRMEQIFAGKGAATGGHQHSIQQQEVSQSAARTDRSKMEAAGERAGKEGAREAHIMNGEAEDGADVGVPKTKPQRPPPPPAPVERRPRAMVRKDSQGEGDSTEQRPTRPLDLDPHRAQVPSENLRYLRQMGFSPRDPDCGTSPEEGHGWIYLNFLVNMAQLHTINVTTDFVRKALSDYSNKFDVSEDGRKVRWKGGDSVTRSSSDGGGGSSNDHTSNNTPDGLSPRKRMKLSHGEARTSAPNLRGSASRRSQPESGKHAYTPLFFHRENSDEMDDSSSEEEEDDSMSSPFPAPVAGDSSGMTSSGIRTNSGVPMPAVKKKQPKHDDGPIIFYNNARFCTDLSGERRSATTGLNPPAYLAASTMPIGKPQTDDGNVDEKRGPLAETSELPEPMDLSDNPIPESMELSFPESSPAQSMSPKEEKPIDLEVTGIGGVWPADNFSISVQSRRARVQAEPAPPVTTSSKTIPPRFAEILRRPEATGPSSRFQKELVASKVRKLPPSKLPPALNYMGFGGDSEDDDSDMDDAQSEAPESIGGFPPSAAPQPVDIRYASSSEEDDEGDSDEEESDGEIDFLAAARAADPEVVRRQEREYEANMAERLADEIPAGSSAATAGGGSGYASPASGAVTREEYRRALSEARANGAAGAQKGKEKERERQKEQQRQKPGDRRVRPSDSMVVNHMKDSSSDASSMEEGSDAKS